MIGGDRAEVLALSRLGSGWPGPAPSPDRLTSAVMALHFTSSASKPVLAASAIGR